LAFELHFSRLLINFRQAPVTACFKELPLYCLLHENAKSAI